MCAEKSDFFHCPAYKLMISDIKSAVLKSPPPEDDNMEEQDPYFDSEPEYEWGLTLAAIPTSSGQQLLLKSIHKPCVELDLKLVWVQGVVLREEEDPGTGTFSLVITDDDGAHEAVIHEYNAVPGGDNPDIKNGSYVGALGQIWSNVPNVVLKASKLMLLNEKSLHRTMWNNEVRLGKAFLAGLIKSVI